MQSIATYGCRASRLRSLFPLASWLLAILYLKGPILDHSWSLPFRICFSECLPTPISTGIGIRLVDGGAREPPPETVCPSLSDLPFPIGVTHRGGYGGSQSLGLPLMLDNLKL